MKKILVPCDFSDPAIGAFQFAVRLAEANAGQVLVLKVIDLPMLYDTQFGWGTYAVDPGLVNALLEDAKQQFKKLMKKYAKGFTNVRFSVEQGPVTPVIRQFAEDKHPDLLVMGTHGAKGLKEFFVGSNTEKMVRFSQVPVFAIRKFVPVSSIKNILYPTALQLNQSDFIKKLKKLQQFFGAKLHLLHVNTPSHFVGDEELEEFAARYKLTNFTLNLRNNRSEEDGILAFAQGKKMDLIAMNTHGRRGISHLVSGSIAEDVVNHIACPTWTYVQRKTK
jgi:nucleotide-binding universal stress UspA family protein